MNKITLTEVKPGDARCGRETVLVGFAPPEGEAPRATFKGLRELFLELWGRLDHASLWMSVVASRRDEMGETTLREFGEMAKFLNVNAVYGVMKQLLANEASKADTREDRLREQCAELVLENTALRRELCELRARGEMPAKES